MEGFGSMENTPTGCGSDLPANPRTYCTKWKVSWAQISCMGPGSDAPTAPKCTQCVLRLKEPPHVYQAHSEPSRPNGSWAQSLEVAIFCSTGRSSKGFLILLWKYGFIFIFGIIWHLEGFGSMENTPTGCGSDLPTILRILKNDPKSRSVNNFSQRSNFELLGLLLDKYSLDLWTELWLVFFFIQWLDTIVYTSRFSLIFENSQNCRQITATPRRSIFHAAKSLQMQYKATNQKITYFHNKTKIP